MSESAQYAILQGAAGDASAVATDEQRCVGGPAGQSPGRGGATSAVGESGLSAVEVVLQDVDEDGFDGDPAVFVAFAADLDDRAVVGAAQVADVGAQQFVGAQTGQQPGDDEGAGPARASRSRGVAAGPPSPRPAVR